jgi:hypothetical protein
MKTPYSNQKSFTLVGLLVAFLLSSVVFPSFGATSHQDLDSKLHLSARVDMQGSQSLPLPLSEEKEEEESRTDKHNTFLLTLFSVVFEKQAFSSAEPTTWAFNHTNATALSDFPIYLAQHLLLI